jgi:hypothetical protein
LHTVSSTTRTITHLASPERLPRRPPAPPCTCTKRYLASSLARAGSAHPPRVPTHRSPTSLSALDLLTSFPHSSDVASHAHSLTHSHERAPCVHGVAHLGSMLALQQPRLSVSSRGPHGPTLPSTASLLSHISDMQWALSPAHTNAVCIPPLPRQLSSPPTNNTQIFKMACVGSTAPTPVDTMNKVSIHPHACGPTVSLSPRLSLPHLLHFNPTRFETAPSFPPPPHSFTHPARITTPHLPPTHLPTTLPTHPPTSSTHPHPLTTTHTHRHSSTHPSICPLARPPTHHGTLTPTHSHLLHPHGAAHPHPPTTRPPHPQQPCAQIEKIKSGQKAVEVTAEPMEVEEKKVVEEEKDVAVESAEAPAEKAEGACAHAPSLDCA